MSSPNPVAPRLPFTAAMATRLSLMLESVQEMHGKWGYSTSLSTMEENRSVHPYVMEENQSTGRKQISPPLYNGNRSVHPYIMEYNGRKQISSPLYNGTLIHCQISPPLYNGSYTMEDKSTLIHLCFPLLGPSFTSPLPSYSPHTQDVLWQ